jgi:hypothetical protein
MKQSVNFRLSKQSVMVLDDLSQKLRLNKTAIIERSIEFYNSHKTSSKKPKNKLLKYAGILPDLDVDEFLKTIYSNRHNKKMRVKF